jgi:hypothetical protein
MSHKSFKNEIEMKDIFVFINDDYVKSRLNNQNQRYFLSDTEFKKT